MRATVQSHKIGEARDSVITVWVRGRVAERAGESVFRHAEVEIELRFRLPLRVAFIELGAAPQPAYLRDLRTISHRVRDDIREYELRRKNRSSRD